MPGRASDDLAGLPIAAVLGEITASLDRNPNAVIQAPPGAGKTTAVPLALLDQNWLGRRRIVMIEPRRLAARAAATRMAQLLGEPVGATCGYRIRLESKVGPKTRIEVVTDGVFTRMIQDDPGLETVGAVLFDECHERRLDTDLGLAFCLDAQEALRPDLRLLAMSATLDAEPVAALMGAAVITAAGRSHPIEIRYLPQPPSRSGIAQLDTEAVAAVIRRAIEQPGGVLVFLPGGAEIRRVQRSLQGTLPLDIDVLPLFGDLDARAQSEALAPSPAGHRKIVLATSIAETSLTIPGISQVVDAGLARTSRYDARSGMTRLISIPVSQAAAEQRAGRAGRTEPGVCWRLWSEVQHKMLRPRDEPEIRTADLTPLALELASWGCADAAALRLLDTPDPISLDAARQLLRRLEALDTDGRLTPLGKAMGGLGIHPRLAHMLLRARSSGEGSLAAGIAAVVSEGGRATRDTDLRAALEAIADGRGHRTDEARHLARAADRIARQAGFKFGNFQPAHAGALLALAFPDRLAEQRGGNGRFRLSGGQGAWLADVDPLAGERYLAVADLDGKSPESRIRLAAPIATEEIETAFEGQIQTEDEIRFDAQTQSVRAKRRRVFGAVVLAETVLNDPSAEAVTQAWLVALRGQLGLAALPWTPAAQSLRHRVAFLKKRDGAEAQWPLLDDADLLETLDEWLAPALAGRRNLRDLAALDMEALMRERIGWDCMRDLDRRAPDGITVPTGRQVAIDYSADIPLIAVKLQEMFGLGATPRIDGDYPLSIHLLSPAGRPIQVTRDLAGFWTGSYKAVRADLRGRYPRHPWPEDPLTAEPTARAKPRRAY